MKTKKYVNFLILIGFIYASFAFLFFEKFSVQALVTPTDLTNLPNNNVNPVPPECGSANGGRFTSFPESDACPSGSAVAGMQEGTFGWSWKCYLSGGLFSPVCNASRIVQDPPACGSSNEKTFFAQPTTNLCLNGHVENISSSSTGWTWKCVTDATLGSTGSTPCSANKLTINPPACGNSDGGSFSSIPSNNLCSSGIPTKVSDINGEWKWTCSNEAGDDYCKATKISESTTVVNNNTSTTTDSDQSKNQTVRIISPTTYAFSGPNLEMIIYSPDAQSVQVEIKKEGDASFIRIVPARKMTSGNWASNINIGNMEGVYYFKAKASINGKAYYSDRVDFNIRSFFPSPQKSPNNYDYSLRDDSDGDGLSNEKEEYFKTDANNPDTDSDGISDGEEVRLGTNPKKNDSDDDGFLDGDEIISGFDPLKHSPGDGRDKILFEDPREKGEINEYYSVNKVEVIQKETGEKRLSFSGKGLPNVFVTVYVYSEPIVVTIKTDSEGNWLYELDRDFEDGFHQAYVAVTDNTGKITAKSNSLPFIKTAEAATVISNAQAQEMIKNQTPTQNSRNSMILFGFIIVVVFLGIALAIIGIVSHRHKYE